MPTGCQIIMLHAVNARLGVELVAPPAGYQPPHRLTVEERAAAQSKADKEKFRQAREDARESGQPLRRAWHRFVDV